MCSIIFTDLFRLYKNRDFYKANILIRVSGVNMKKLGFGLMRLPLMDENTKMVDMNKFIELIDYFMQHGYNYFDTAYPYLEGNSEKAVKEAITDRYPRDSFFLATKLPIFNLEHEEDMEKIFNDQLIRCGVEYFDYYLLHNVSSKHTEKFTKIDSFGFVKKLKDEGKIRHMGISCHDTAEFLEDMLIKHPEIDFVQLQINYLDWDNKVIQSGRCYEVACRYNKPVVIMEGLKGGALINIPENAKKLLNEYSSDSLASWSFRYNLSLDNIMVILSGMNDLDNLKENIDIFEDSKKLNQEEYDILKKVVEQINDSNSIKCTDCRYCVDYCPKGINIPKLFELYNSQKLLAQSHSLGMYYRNFISQGNNSASECIKCGKCMDYCPQKIEIPKELERVAETFE